MPLMELIDTHAHIYVKEFDADKMAMLDRATGKGVREILMPAIDSSTHDAMLAVEQIDPLRYKSMMGLHPCSVNTTVEGELKIVTDHLAKSKFVAVGEIGLDFYWDTTFKEQQYDAFHRQIELALHYDLPIVIHSRNATAECLEVVAQHQQGKLRGVFHCFSGDINHAKQAIDLGFYLGIGGVLTFKNGGLDKIMEAIGLDRIVLETDAPYLAPVPFRGKRNEPSYLTYVAEKLALIKNISVDEVALITTKNAQTLFAL